MKLDPTKPYGTIYGPTTAQYEQNGMFFTGSGEVIERVDEPGEGEADSPVALWLQELLSGGAMTQPNIYKAAERDGQPWAEVKTVPGVKRYKYRRDDMWKLIPN
ncbi:MAG: hypothetical protein JWR07_1906 [Nevskia sp.]|nr:hypothetical protein [Nevskia sp.]